MKNQTKLIVIVTMIALLMCAVFSFAIADEKIYTSPTFKLPADQIKEWVETQDEEPVPEEGTPAEGTSEEGNPEEGTPEEGTPEEGEPEEDDWGEDAREEDSLDYIPEGALPASSTESETPAEGTEPEGEIPAEGTEGETPAEGTEPEGEIPAEGTEAQSEEGNLVGETVQPERSVQIRSSQGDVVTEGEIIYLTSKLKGFDGLDIAYQWQVDRGDGEGWVDVEGANRPKHMFVADRETITYSWRLVVNILDGE